MSEGGCILGYMGFDGSMQAVRFPMDIAEIPRYPENWMTMQIVCAALTRDETKKRVAHLHESEQ